MLSKEDSEILARVGPETAMGRLNGPAACGRNGVNSADEPTRERQMEGVDLRILFTYRLLVQAGYLDDDIGAEEPIGNQDAPRRIAVHDDLCIGCYACRNVCPASAIRVWDEEAHITNPLRCAECVDTPCVPACPTAALEDKGLGVSRFP